MKFILATSFALAVVICSQVAHSSTESDESLQEESLKDAEFEGLPVLSRDARATCDLLSFEIKGIKVNDSACAAHCLTKWRQGYRGGRCSLGICRCRK